MKRFEGRAVLITGAASGIGAACVQRLYDEGASVAIADIDQARINDIAARFDEPGRVYAAALDVSDPAQAQTFVAEAQNKLGNLHGLINCAGIKGVGNVLDCDLDNWKRVMAVNLDGTFLMPSLRTRCPRRQELARDRQHFLGGRHPRRSESFALCRVEVWRFRHHPHHGCGTRKLRHPRQCHCARDDPHSIYRLYVRRPREDQAHSCCARDRSRRRTRRDRSSRGVPADR